MTTNLSGKNPFLLLLVGFLVFPAFFLDHSFSPTPVAAPVLSGSGPSSAADWVIASDTVIRDENYTINGNIIVQNGANLTLVNVTLWMNSSVDGECSIAVNSGGELYLHNCTVTAYNTSNAWFLSANAGSTLLLNTTMISYAGYNWAYPGLRIGTDNAKVINCTMLRNYWGLWLYKANATLIEDNHITLSSYYGIYIGEANNTLLKSNSITYSSYDGVYLGNSYHCTVSGNTVTNSSEDGIELASSGNCTVSGNTVTNSSCGIVLGYSGDITVSGNTITNSEEGIQLLWFGNNNIVSGNTIMNSEEGIYLGKSGNNNIVSGNTVTNSSSKAIIVLEEHGQSTIDGNTLTDNWEGIYLELSGDITISGNNFTNTITDAIALEDSSDISISGNTVTNSGSNGIDLWYSGNNTISRNTVTNSRWYGIGLHQSGNCTVRGNIVTNSGNKGIALENSGDITVSGNIVTNSSARGIKLHTSSHNTVSGNTVTNSNYGIDLWISGNNTVSRNTVTHSTKDGMFLLNSRNNLICENIITNSSQHGIYLDQNTSNCLLWDNHLAANAGGNAYDGNGTNQWDNGTHGNWYDDYRGLDSNKNGIGDIPYSIGGGLVEDRYPLMNLVLPDASPPTLDSPDDVTYTVGTMWHTITWQPSDTNPYWYQILRNGTVIADTAWNGSSITVEIFGLPIGTYNFTIVVYDRLGYRATDEVLVIVKPAEKETTEDESQLISGLTFPLVGLTFGVCLFLIRSRRRNRARS